MAQRRALPAGGLHPEGLDIIDGATHMDLYDGPGMDQSIQCLAPFYTNAL